jgi:folate-binding protein YgfZ
MFHVKHAYHHTDRRIILIQGEDQMMFLQGLVTNDVQQLADKGIIYAAMLTPQGKFLFDFFMTQRGDQILLECCVETHEQLLRKLNLYKLRARVNISDVSDLYSVYSIHNHVSDLTLDPRCAKLGYRILIRKGEEDKILLDIPISTNRDDYEHLRLSLGIPEAIKDMIPEKSIPLECSLDHLNAISWSKGCYVGQELTARTHYRGMVRKRLLPVTISGELPATLNPSILQGDQEVGTLYSHNQQIGIARLRIVDIQDSLKGSKTLTCGNAQLVPYVPEWMLLKN